MTEGGLYTITHTASNRCYVGSAANLARRFAHHRSRLNNGKHHNNPLQRDWADFGAGAFRFDVVARFDTAREVRRRFVAERDLLASFPPELTYNAMGERERALDAEGKPLVGRVVKLSADQWEDFDALGGLDWLRALIKRAKEPK